MKGLSRTQSFAIPARTLRNYFCGRPIITIFEVTTSCNARCRHCNMGGIRPDEQRLAPEEYREYISEMQPAVVHLSGGEPLLREDLPEIVRAIKDGNHLPYTIVVSNGYLLNEQRYLELKEAGVDRFAISLDFPNREHDEFRRLRGLYSHLEQLIPRLASYGRGDIAMNCVITWANLPYLEELANRCAEWGVDISYSAYSALRTGDEQYSICAEDDLGTLWKTIQNLIAIKREKGTILTPTSVLLGMYRFFREGGISDCSAGRRFLFVQPDGSINPCAMQRDKRYTSRATMLEDFSANNKCKQCYVACRAYTDKSIWSLSRDVVEHARY